MRKAAIALDKFLEGSGNIDEKLAPPVEIKKYLGRGDGFAALERCGDSYAPAEERVKSFCRVAQDMDEKTAECEAQRCLQCDLRLKITPIKFWGNY